MTRMADDDGAQDPDDDDGGSPDDLDARIEAAVKKALGNVSKDGEPPPKDITGDKNIEEAMKAIVEDAMVPLRESIATITDAVTKKPAAPKPPAPKPEEAPDIPPKFSLKRFLVGGED